MTATRRRIAPKGGELFLVFVAAIAFGPASRAGELEDARAAFRQARASVQSLHLLVDVESTPSEEAKKLKLIPVSSRWTVEWWLTPDAARWREVYAGRTVDRAWSDAEQRSLARDRPAPERTQTSGDISAMPKLNASTNPWRCAQWTIPNLCMTLDDACASSDFSVTSRWEELEKERLFRVTLNHRRTAEIDVWLSPRHNFLPVRQSYRHLEHKVASDDTVRHFREWQPGVFFPEQIETKRFFGNDRLLVTEKVTFRDVELSAAIPAKTFELTFPPNVPVFDKVRGRMGRTGPDGKLTANAIPYPPLTTIPDAPDGEEVVPSGAVTWPYYAATGFVAIVGAGWLIARARRTARS